MSSFPYADENVSMHFNSMSWKLTLCQLRDEQIIPPSLWSEYENMRAGLQ